MQGIKDILNNKKFALPSWLVLSAVIFLLEVLLQSGSGLEFQLTRAVTIFSFSLAFSCVMGLLVSFIPVKAQKWITLAVSVLMLVLYMTEYLVHNAFRYYMTLASMLNGAGGVAADYSTEAWNLILGNLWIILLLALPVLAYGVLGEAKKATMHQRLRVFCAAAALAVLGYGMIHVGKVDLYKFDLSENIDNTVSSFGLPMGLSMDVLQGLVGDSGFEENLQVPTEPAPPTQAAQATTPPQTEETTETTAPTEPPRVFKPHAYDLDFAALAESETNSSVADIHRYVASQAPAMENEYTGLFAGKNLIFITAEAFSSQVIDPERTPTLYRMANEGIRFDDYYQPAWGCSTTGGEYSNLLSLIPYNGTEAMKLASDQNLFFTIGNQLRQQGYSSAAFHNNDHTFYGRHLTHENLGYDRFLGYGNGLEEGLSNLWPRSDEEMFRYTIPMYIDQQPFSLYYMTVSGHSTYQFYSNHMAEKNKEYVKDVDASDTVKAYLACNMELEHAMAYLIQSLEEKGIADDTVIVIGTDHYPYGLTRSETWGTDRDYLYELMGKQDTNDCTVRDKSTLIIWSGCLEDQDLVVDTPVQSLDILPTLLNLFGVEYDSRLLCGRDVFSEQQSMVCWFDGSWKTEKGFYSGPTGKFTPVEGVEVSDDYIDYMRQYVRNKFTYSRMVRNCGYFNILAEHLSQQGILDIQPE